MGLGFNLIESDTAASSKFSVNLVSVELWCRVRNARVIVVVVGVSVIKDKLLACNDNSSKISVMEIVIVAVEIVLTIPFMCSVIILD